MRRHPGLQLTEPSSICAPDSVATECLVPSPLPCSAPVSHPFIPPTWMLTRMRRRYMAPELALSKPYDHKVDVFSFAITLWEMIRLKLPFANIPPSFFPACVQKAGLRPKLKKFLPEPVRQLLTVCWHEHAVRRPDFRQIVPQIEVMLATALREEAQPQSRRAGAKIYCDVVAIS